MTILHFWNILCVKDTFMCNQWERDFGPGGHTQKGTQQNSLNTLNTIVSGATYFCFPRSSKTSRFFHNWMLCELLCRDLEPTRIGLFPFTHQEHPDAPLFQSHEPRLHNDHPLYLHTKNEQWKSSYSCRAIAAELRVLYTRTIITVLPPSTAVSFQRLWVLRNSPHCYVSYLFLMKLFGLETLGRSSR